MNKIKVFDIALIAIFSALIFSLEFVMQALPNIQLTIFLIVLFSKKLGFIQTTFIVLIYTLLDTCFMGGFNFIYFPFMFIACFVIPLTMGSIFKKVNEPILLALLGILFSFIYSWILIIPGVFITKVAFFDYLISDILFEVILAFSSFLTILWLYNPLSKLLDKLISDRND